MNELIIGAVTGILFGFFMQKAQVIRYDRQLGALRFKDMTIVKFMLTTILVAMVGIYLLLDLGIDQTFRKTIDSGWKRSGRPDLRNRMGHCGILPRDRDGGSR